MTANPTIIIIQVEVSGTADAPRGGVGVIGSCGIGPGSPTEITGVGGVSGADGKSVGAGGETGGAGGESVGAGGESVGAGGESVGAGGESVGAVCVIGQDAEVARHRSENSLRSITLLSGAILLRMAGVCAVSWVSSLDVLLVETGLTPGVVGIELALLFSDLI